MTENGTIELMAPAGNFESLQAAIENGADSVYFGVDQLNMRARASINFTIEDLPEIVKRCAVKKVRTYLTLNTIIYDHDLSIIKTLLDAAKSAGITAVIVMDQAVIAYARQIGMEIHISTQINITNIETVKFYAMFADPMVMSRELSLRQVKKIVEQIERDDVRGPNGRLVEVEIFGHGALCMAVSGKCYLSLHSHNSSANRGACKQNCRKKYTVIDQESGFEIELSDVENRAFFPEEVLNTDSNEAFYQMIEKNESHFQTLLANANSKGARLKYVAQLENGKASVGLQEIDSTHDFYNLEGSDNIILFYTNRYKEQPLIIKGAGAGAEVTAAGILGDIIRIGKR